MKKIVFILLSTLCILSGSEKGSEIFERCGVCHGDKGQKHSLNVSRFIAGLDEDDVIDILREYRDGKRNQYGFGTMMNGQAKKLSDEDIEAVAAYVSALPPVEIDESNVEKPSESLDGAEIFKRCAVCHGANADKRSLNVSGYIAGMNDKDIINILHEYQSGKRNKYGYGSMMKGQAKKLSEEQLDAVAKYVASLPPIKTNENKDEKPKPKITKKQVDYNTFMKEYFDASTNPNETFSAAKKKWAEELERRKKEAPAAEAEAEAAAEAEAKVAAEAEAKAAAEAKTAAKAAAIAKAKAAIAAAKAKEAEKEKE